MSSMACCMKAIVSMGIYFIDTAEALDSFMRHRYCLVIIDPALEDMDGRELLRTMRQAKVVPILVLTGILSLEDEIELLSLGATVGKIRRQPKVCQTYVAQQVSSE